MTRAREKLYLLSSGNPTRYLSEIDESLLEKIGNKPTSKPTINSISDDLPF